MYLSKVQASLSSSKDSVFAVVSRYLRIANRNVGNDGLQIFRVLTQNFTLFTKVP